MEYYSKIVLFTLFCLIFQACNKNTTDDNGDMFTTIERKDVVLSAKQRSYVNYGNALALDYYKIMYEKYGDKDLFVSPLGLEYLFGLLNTGATGMGSQEILHVMGLESGENEELNSYLYSLNNQLEKLDPLTSIRTANIGFIRNDFILEPSYVTDVKKNYDATVTSEDFSKSEELTKRINQWCYDKTEGMIPDIIGFVDPATMFYMFNAIYFNGKWTSKFDKKNTENELFFLENGTTSSIPMMKQQATFSFIHTNGCSIASLPYGNEAFRMNIILPNETTDLNAFISTLDNDLWETILSSMLLTPLDVWLPRFETENDFENLNRVVSALGISSIFLSGNLDKLAKDIAAQCIIQKTHIKVDEDGTQAAAVTGNIGFGSNGNDGVKSYSEFHANRPFAYLITEYSTGAILFAGKYTGVKE